MMNWEMWLLSIVLLVVWWLVARWMTRGRL